MSSDDDSNGPEYYAQQAASENLKMAEQAREEAERTKVWRDHWIEEGRPTPTTMYMHRYYEEDEGEKHIRECETAADHYEIRAKEVYEKLSVASQKLEGLTNSSRFPNEYHG